MSADYDELQDRVKEAHPLTTIIPEGRRVALFPGDCLESLRKMPDCSVDSIVTDPPYGMDFQSHRVAAERRKPKVAGDTKPFIWWLAEAHRVLRDGGGLVCFTDWRNQEMWRMAIECAGFTVKSHCVWDRAAHGMGDLRSSFAPRHDVFWFATKGRFRFPDIAPDQLFAPARPRRLQSKRA